jgi:hypothetical protein
MAAVRAANAHEVLLPRTVIVEIALAWPIPAAAGPSDR